MSQKQQRDSAVDSPPPIAGARRLTLREELKLLTHERLLDAALTVFREIGYRAATVEQIAAQAGTNRATFYIHFKDKLDVAVGLARRVATASAHTFLELDKIDDPTVASVKIWLKSYIDIGSADRLLGQLLNEALASELKFAEESMAFLGRVADRMTNYLSRYSGKRKQLARSKVVLVEMMVGRYTAHIPSQGIEFPGEGALDALAESIWCILFSNAAEPVSSRRSSGK